MIVEGDNMITTIKNNFLTISVKTHGAELCSITSLETGKEFVWQADPTYWGKHSPNLFPIIGFLKNNQFKYNDKLYDLTKHGLVRDMDFTLIDKGATYLVYLVESTTETMKSYPFPFKFYVKYNLEEKCVRVSYEVENIGDTPMYFSVGGHTAFNCDIASNQAYLKFEQPETVDTYLMNLENGLISNKKAQVLQNEAIFPLKYELFDIDTFILEGLKSKSVCLLHDSETENVKFTFEGFPYLALWSPKGPFICIEPWMGLPDFENTDQEISTKIGHNTLPAKASFNCSYTIEII